MNENMVITKDEDEDERKEKKEEKVIKKRIGTFTFGILLILLGIVSVLSLFFSVEIIRYTISLWPIFLISLGVEAIIYSTKDNIEIKYDFWNILLSVFIIGFTMLVSMGNFFVNELFMHNDNFNKVIDEISERIYEDITEEDNLIETSKEINETENHIEENTPQ